MRRLFGALAALAALAGTAAAQPAFPTKPVTLVVPFAAGGPSDVIARLLAASMTRTFGEEVLVENVAGAGGTIAAAKVAAAPADGYEILLHHVALSAAPSLYKDLPYDTTTAFAPIGLINYGPYVLVARKDFPADDFAAFAEAVKTDASLAMAHAGNGSGSHLCGILLDQALGTKLTFVPYKGTGPALADVVAGQIDFTCDQTTTALPQIEAGTVKAYAVTGPARLEQLPDLPTTREAGMTDFELTVWHALYAPRGTPEPVLSRLSQALETALGDEAVAARFAGLATLQFPEGERGADALARKLGEEVAHWKAVTQAAGLAPE